MTDFRKILISGFMKIRLVEAEIGPRGPTERHGKANNRLSPRCERA